MASYDVLCPYCSKKHAVSDHDEKNEQGFVTIICSCPMQFFEVDIIKYQPVGAKNTEQANQPDSGE